jgi:transcriptional regulator with PAS, ATPase and Fis domain
MAGMISRNKGMLRIFSELERIAAGTSAVLIHGESGTGKELLAHAIHTRSPRRSGPFVAFNAAALSPTLVESSLFGHCKGAFTGADSDKKGYFEVANGGTIFLDEIGDMQPEIQAKLLRALQQKEIERVGEQGHVRKVDVRVVAATNKDLPRAVQEGAFREDLFYRLNVVDLQVPPLRERREDILPLAEYFLKRHADAHQQPVPALSRDARALLLGHSFPGNVRELENMMEVGFLFQEGGVVDVDPLERKLRSSTMAPAPDVATNGGSLRQLVERFEERAVRDALARNDNNVSATAKSLGLSRQMLHEKIKKYSIATREN